MNPQNEHERLEKMLAHNAKLLEDNNKILHKLYRNQVWTFWTRVIWYVLLLGLPFIFYFYILQPYFEVFGSNYETFRAGINEIPGLKGLEQILNNASEGRSEE